jgi:hypothetical protein
VDDVVACLSQGFHDKFADKGIILYDQNTHSKA